MTEITWDQWREDVIRLDGTVLQKNVLFIRGSLGNIQYHCPIWVEQEDVEGYDLVEETKAMLTEQIRNHRKTLDG